MYCRAVAAEMVALRPPSYDTIDDPPPYPDDDESSLADKQRRRRRLSDNDDNSAATTTSRAGFERHLANDGESRRLRDAREADEDSDDHRVIRQAVRRCRDAVGRRPLRADLSTSGPRLVSHVRCSRC